MSPRDTKTGFSDGDHHIIVNDGVEVAKCFDYSGKMQWTIPCAAKGVGGRDWREKYADTPPGLYRIGAVYDDLKAIKLGHTVPFQTKLSYGWVTFDLIDEEGQEWKNGRSGICWHGGGSVHGINAAWADLQPYLAPTHGCLRSHNVHLYEKVLPLTRLGNVYVSVFQDA